MKTVHEVSEMTGVSIRTLHYYDKIGLLRPSEITDAGYRLYDDTALERLQQILMFRELEFPRKEIIRILDSEGFDKEKALKQQIELLTLKREHLENLIAFARAVQTKGEITMDFAAFDTSKIREYTRQAREQWGDTDAYHEFEQKHAGEGEKEFAEHNKGLMALFAEFGTLKDQPADCGKVQKQVEKLQKYISDYFYQCTPQILEGLGKMYSADERFRTNIDKTGGKGCAEFVSKAIAEYCRK